MKTGFLMTLSWHGEKKCLSFALSSIRKKNVYYRLEIIVCVFLSERFDTGYLCYIHLKPILWGFAY